MKKSLLALAVLGAFAGAASAQTNVTIYGVVDAGVQYANGGQNTNWTLGSGLQSGSRLGFKGTEDLGGGLSAIFTLENGFTVDDGQLGQNSRLFGRQAWVGLKGSFGEVKLGRQQTPLYYAVAAVDPFAIGLAGNAQSVFGSGATLYSADPLARTDNTISYAINNSGFNAGLNYGFGETAGDNTANRNVAVGLGYANGPVNVQYAYQKAKAGATNGANDLTVNFIGGTYDLGVAKAHLAYADNKSETAAGATTKVRDWLLGVSAPVGSAGTVMASYIRNDVKDVNDSKSNQYALGYTHSLSKRTNLYTSFAYVKNDAAVKLKADANGDNGRVLNVGVRHQF